MGNFRDLKGVRGNKKIQRGKSGLQKQICFCLAEAESRQIGRQKQKQEKSRKISFLLFNLLFSIKIFCFLSAFVFLFFCSCFLPREKTESESRKNCILLSKSASAFRNSGANWEFFKKLWNFEQFLKKIRNFEVKIEQYVLIFLHFTQNLSKSKLTRKSFSVRPYQNFTRKLFIQATRNPNFFALWLNKTLRFNRKAREIQYSQREAIKEEFQGFIIAITQ